MQPPWTIHTIIVVTYLSTVVRRGPIELLLPAQSKRAGLTQEVPILDPNCQVMPFLRQERALQAVSCGSSVGHSTAYLRCQWPEQGELTQFDQTFRNPQLSWRTRIPAIVRGADVLT
jgi:hypothetical protein